MKFPAACLTALLIATVAEDADKPPTDPALHKLAAAFAEAFNAKDAARVASFYADDAIVMPPDQTMIRGHRNVEAYYVRGFRQVLARAEETVIVVIHSLPIAYVLAAHEGMLPAQRVPLVAHAHPYRFARAELDGAVTLLEDWCAAPTW